MRIFEHRDQEASPFASILWRLLDATPGAVGAVLVDEFGEGVDYAGTLAPFDIRIAGAHWQLVLRLTSEALSKHVGRTDSLIVSGSRKSFFSKRVLDEYVLVVVLTEGSPFEISWRALYQTEFELRVEAGWEPPEDVDKWVVVTVHARSYDGWRPTAVQTSDGALAMIEEVIGAVVGLSEGECGFRVQLQGGAEVTLVREPSGVWFSDRPV